MSNESDHYGEKRKWVREVLHVLRGDMTKDNYEHSDGVPMYLKNFSKRDYN